MNKLSSSHSALVRRLLVGLLLLVACCGALQAQVAIPGTRVQYTFPSKWRFLSTQKIDQNTTLYHYYYTSKIVVSKGDTALPYLRIRVRKNYTGTIYDYVYDRYVQEPYQPLKDYTTGLGLPKTGGMGYIGAYTNVNDKRDYQFRMVYFKVQNTIVEFRLETTKATYPQMAKEVESILGSLTF
jgi:hypothetical protein